MHFLSHNKPVQPGFIQYFYVMQPKTPYGLMEMEPLLKVEDLDVLLDQANKKQMEVLCLPPLMIRHARQTAHDKGIRLATIIGYPFGYPAIESKLAEMVLAIVDGVDDLYICANQTAIRNNDWQYIARELGTLLPVARNKQKKIFLVTELSFLTEEDILRCADIFGAAGVDGIITSTGLFAGLNHADKLASYRQFLAEAVPVLETLPDNVNPELHLSTGANGFFVKSGISLPKAVSLLQDGMFFEQPHQN